MRDLSGTPLFNLADPKSKCRLMREALDALDSNPDLAFVSLHLVSAFIDGLAAGNTGKTKASYLLYLQEHFPQLCQELGAEIFYTHVRSKAVHEFALRPPLALSRSTGMQDKNAYCETVSMDGAEWTLVNLERVLADFRTHLGSIEGDPS